MNHSQTYIKHLLHSHSFTCGEQWFVKAKTSKGKVIGYCTKCKAELEEYPKKVNYGNYKTPPTKTSATPFRR